MSCILRILKFRFLHSKKNFCKFNKSSITKIDFLVTKVSLIPMHLLRKFRMFFAIHITRKIQAQSFGCWFQIEFVKKFNSDFWSPGRTLIFCSSFLDFLGLEPRTFWAQSQQRRPMDQAVNCFERKNVKLMWYGQRVPMPEIFRWKSWSFVLNLKKKSQKRNFGCVEIELLLLYMKTRCQCLEVLSLETDRCQHQTSCDL
jgi:hypothetical protein